MADHRILVSLHGSKFGYSRSGHLIEDVTKIMVPSWLDRGARSIQFDHFNGPVLDANKWLVYKGSDGGAATPVINVQKGGVVRGVAGAGAGATMAVNGSQINGSLNFEPDQGYLEMMGSLKLSAITTSAVYIGLTDQSTALAMPFTLAGAALTSNASNGAGFLFDTSATAATWKCVSVATDVDGAVTDTGIAPATTAFDHIGLDMNAAGDCNFYLNGKLVAQNLVAVTPTTPLCIVVAGFRRAASALNIDVDYLYAAADRPL